MTAPPTLACGGPSFISVKGLMLDKEGIEKILHHREAALCLDGITDYDEGGKSITAFRRLSRASWECMGHFPGHPVSPSHWQLEMTQLAAGVLFHCLHGGINGLPMPVTQNGILNLRQVEPPCDLYISVAYLGQRELSERIFKRLQVHSFSAEIRNGRGKPVYRIAEFTCHAAQIPGFTKP